MEIKDLSEKTKKALLCIYKDIFKYSDESLLNIFLCGSAEENSARDLLRDRLKVEKSFKIIYPEDLFIDCFNRNKHYDMLSMEKFLAKNCDVICIICEDKSPGALVELGAFANHNETQDKIVALIQNKYKNHKSFIMIGPIKYIQKRNKENVIFYSSDFEDTYRKLSKLLRNKFKLKGNSTPKDVDSIIGQYYLILIIIYYFKTIPVQDLNRYLRYIVNEYSIKIDDFELLYSASLKQLYKDKVIEKIANYKADFYCLTENGKLQFERLFKALKLAGKTKKSDAIRLLILSEQSYEHHLS